MKNDLESQVKALLNSYGFDDNLKGYPVDFDSLANDTSGLISSPSSQDVALRNRLSILYEYERHYLDLIKEYKEEIKFASSVQEEIRKERVQFFTQSLKEVTNSLKDCQVDSTTASKWIADLVDSYSKSLDISADLANTSVIDIIGKLRGNTKKLVEALKTDD